VEYGEMPAPTELNGAKMLRRDAGKFVSASATA